MVKRGVVTAKDRDEERARIFEASKARRKILAILEILEVDFCILVSFETYGRECDVVTPRSANTSAR